MIVWFLRARTFEPSVVVSFSYFCFCFCFFKETRIRTESAELIVKCPPLLYIIGCENENEKKERKD